MVKKLGLRALGRGCQKGHLEHLCRVGTLVFVSKAPKNRKHLTTDLLLLCLPAIEPDVSSREEINPVKQTERSLVESQEPGYDDG